MAKVVNKKSEKKRLELNQKTFTRISESFVSDFINLQGMVSMGLEDNPDLLRSFDKNNQRWKTFARGMITKNPHAYKTRELREKFILTFERFVEHWLESSKKQKEVEDIEVQEEEVLNPIDGEMIMVKWLDYDPDFLNKVLNDMGVKTQAKTHKGLSKVVEKLDEAQKRSFFAKLGIL